MVEKNLIGIDLSFVRPDHKNGGTETYVKNLMHGFEELGVSGNIVYFIHKDIYEDYKKEFIKSKFIIYSGKGSHKIRMLLFQTFSIPKLVKNKKIKLVFEPTYTSGLRWKCNYPIVSNPEDLQFKFYPEYFNKIRWIYINLMTWLTFRKSDYVISISKYVDGTLHQFYPKLLKGKTRTLYLPVRYTEKDPISVNGINCKFILSVNALRKNKNLITLIKAYEKISDYIDEKLVLVGIKQNDTDDLSTYVKKHNMGNKVIFTGFISDEQLRWLYENASLFVTSSLYEGFGMTPVEAMGYGCPVISSKDTSLYEATKGLAVYYEPTEDENALGKKILDVLNGRLSVDTEKNRRAVREAYDLRVISKEYYDFFTSIIKKNEF